MNLETNRYIDLIVIHCTDTYKRMDIGVDEVRKWHLNRGWSDIGYHYIIKRDGTIEEGRPLDKIGAHCKGHNKNSIGIAYVGGRGDNDKPEDNRTVAQKKTLAALCINLQAEHQDAEIKGHNELSSKACPSFDVQEDIYNWDLYLFLD